MNRLQYYVCSTMLQKLIKSFNENRSLHKSQKDIQFKPNHQMYRLNEIQ